MDNPSLSIVIPCLNEEKTLKQVIEKCYKVFEKLDIAGEVIISDNGSTDGSICIAQSMGAKIVQCSKKGYGNALCAGFKAAQYSYIAFLDADNTYDVMELINYFEVLDDDTDMVIGSRLKGHIDDGAMPFLNRYFGTPFLTKFVNILFGSNISDINCGMRLMKKTTFDSLNFASHGMEFASELFIEFKLNNCKIKEIPISLHQDFKGRKPHLRPLRDGLRHLILILYKNWCR